MNYTLASFPLAEIDPRRNIRQSFDEEEIRLLAESLKTRQIHPIVVLPDGTLIDGGKRVRAAALAGMTELLAVVTEEALGPEAIREIQIVAAFHRSDPCPFDRWQAMEAFTAAHSGWTNKQVADALHLDPKMVKVLLSPSSCIEAAREALREGRIGISICHELSLVPPAEQAALLDLKLSGQGREAVARARRRGAAGTVPPARVNRVRLHRPSGQVVTISGQEMSLDEAAEELSALAAEMRRADKQGIGIKAFVANCRDRAEVGA